MYNLFNTLGPPNPTLFKLTLLILAKWDGRPPHLSKGIILKTQASVLRAGYMEGQEIYSKFTKTSMILL